MRDIDGLAVAVALALIVGSSASASRADQQNMALPEVTVTAPPIPVPSYKKFNPYSTNPRVEEDKWVDIPCGGSRVAAGGVSGCKSGPPMGSAGYGLPSGDKSIDLTNCHIAHDLVMTTLGNLAVEADLMVFDPNFVGPRGPMHRGCYVQQIIGDLRDDFPDMNQMTRQGGAWRGFLADGDLSTMAFSVGSSDCLALEKRGPRWGSGYVYVIHASLCHRDGRAVETADVDRVLAALLVRQYEPRGNLRVPP
jgi:hypothetical protein